MATHHVIQAALQSAIDDSVFPGAQLAVRLHGELQCVVVAGRLSSEPPGLPVLPSTIYDLALSHETAGDGHICVAPDSVRQDCA